jgi:hypothetical protein
VIREILNLTNNKSHKFKLMTNVIVKRKEEP